MQESSYWAGGSTMENLLSWSNFYEVDLEVNECIDLIDEVFFFDMA